MFDFNKELDFVNVQDYPDELVPTSEISIYIFDIVEKLGQVQKRLNEFEEEYLQSDEETRASMEMPTDWSLKAWVEFLERIKGEIGNLSDRIWELEY